MDLKVAFEGREDSALDIVTKINRKGVIMLRMAPSDTKILPELCKASA